MKNTENSKTLFRFNLKSFLIFLSIFVIEVIIALFVNDRIVRPYLGDVLVVIMIYYFAKSFISTKTIYLVSAVLLFAYMVEIGQYYNLVEVLNLQNNGLMRVVIGSSFSWIDILAYTIGGMICYFIDRKKSYDKSS